jgi:protein-S-isoprenylcysteine O-methyltransferase Ste14
VAIRTIGRSIQIAPGAQTGRDADHARGYRYLRHPIYTFRK